MTLEETRDLIAAARHDAAIEREQGVPEKADLLEKLAAALVAAQGVAPVLPSSGVDEDALAEVIDKALIRHSEMAGMSNQERWDARDDIARAVADWLKEQGR